MMLAKGLAMDEFDMMQEDRLSGYNGFTDYEEVEDIDDETEDEEDE